MSQTFKVNEIFYSIQGEGMRAGTANVFVRFSNCNLRCNKPQNGFDCDTEFVSGRDYSADELIASVREISANVPADAPPGTRSIIFTGGEPSLQLTQELVDLFHDAGFFLAIETNGTNELPDRLDWICVSPKTAEHTLKQRVAAEVKYVRAHGQGIPETKVQAGHYLLSPAFEPDGLDRKNLEWCIKLVKENPTWRLSTQQHKLWTVR